MTPEIQWEPEVFEANHSQNGLTCPILHDFSMSHFVWTSKRVPCGDFLGNLQQLTERKCLYLVFVRQVASQSGGSSSEAQRVPLPVQLPTGLHIDNWGLDIDPRSSGCMASKPLPWPVVFLHQTSNQWDPFAHHENDQSHPLPCHPPSSLFIVSQKAASITRQCSKVMVILT